MTSSMLSATAPPLTSNYSKKLIALDPYSLSKRSSLNTPFIHKTLSLRHRNLPSHFIKLCYATDSSSSRIQGEGKESETVNADGTESGLTVEVGNPNRLTFIPTARLSLGDQAFFLLSFIACTTSIAFTSLVIAAVPTLFAMGRAATSLAKLADTAREELPSTMAAIRLSGMEISDLTLELSDLSQEIADGVNKSTQAVQVAEAGIRQMGTLARQQTMSMIEERANLPVISLQPAVVGAAKKTSHAVGRATKNLIYFLSRGEFSSKSEDDSTDRLGL